MKVIQVRMTFADRQPSEAETAVLWDCLPPARRARLVQQPAEKHLPVLLAYGLLLSLLREQYGWQILPPVATDAGGKAYFPAYPGIHFSLSHTDGAAMAAISDAPVGVDIQRIRPVSQRMLKLLEGERTAENFFTHWVRWEARAKQDGSGLSEMMRREPPMERGHFYNAVEMRAGYAAGVASSGLLPKENIRNVPLDVLTEILPRDKTASP